MRPEYTRPPQKKKLYVVPVVIGLVLVLLAGAYGAYRAGWFSFTKKAAAPTEIKSAEEIKEEIEDVVTQVGKHIVLPEGEAPTVATVTDPALLKDQAFFANAKTGHKVLIYTQARKAFLYDPERDILIEAAPLVVDVP